MTPLESVSIRQVQRLILPDGRKPPPTHAILHLSTDRKREQHLGWAGYRLQPSGRDYYRRAPRTAMITRCDLRQRFHLNMDDRQYAVWPIEPLLPGPNAVGPSNAATVTQQHRQPTILIETETVDTGEQRSVLGWTARHVVTTRRIIPLERAIQGPSTTITDGWYIDVELPAPCDTRFPRRRSGHAVLSGHIMGQQPDWPMFKDVGEPERGFPVLTRTTSTHRFENGSATELRSVDEMEVTELSTARIDPDVFEVPQGFMKVEWIRQEPTPPLLIRLHQWYVSVLGRCRSARRASQ